MKLCSQCALASSLQGESWHDRDVCEYCRDRRRENPLAEDIANYGFHSYAYEIAGMVRRGVMTREEGLRKITRQASPVSGMGLAAV